MTLTKCGVVNVVAIVVKDANVRSMTVLKILCLYYSQFPIIFWQHIAKFWGTTYETDDSSGWFTQSSSFHLRLFVLRSIWNYGSSSFPINRTPMQLG